MKEMATEANERIVRAPNERVSARRRIEGGTLAVKLLHRVLCWVGISYDDNHPDRDKITIKESLMRNEGIQNR